MRKNITPEEKAYRDKLVEAAAQKHGWRLLHDTVMRMFDGSALYEIALTNRRHRNHIYSSDWEYAEIYFDDVHYRHKNRDEADRIGYGVVSVRLPRKLPNVLFDSIKHGRQQFGPKLDQKQRISLEGNFDASFATYFNEKYTMDSLSFITPEVMLALVEADNYDIEIMHDRLLLFGR